MNRLFKLKYGKKKDLPEEFYRNRSVSFANVPGEEEEEHNDEKELIMMEDGMRYSSSLLLLSQGPENEFEEKKSLDSVDFATKMLSLYSITPCETAFLSTLGCKLLLTNLKCINATQLKNIRIEHNYKLKPLNNLGFILSFVIFRLQYIYLQKKKESIKNSKCIYEASDGTIDGVLKTFGKLENQNTCLSQKIKL